MSLVIRLGTGHIRPHTQRRPMPKLSTDTGKAVPVGAEEFEHPAFPDRNCRWSNSWRA